MIGLKFLMTDTSISKYSSRFSTSPAEDDASFEAQKNADTLQIIKRVRGGDVDAYALIVECHCGYVSRILSKHVPQSQVPELAHEVFVSAFKSLSSFGGRSMFKHWLARIAVRRAYDYWRREYRCREVAHSQLSERHLRWLELAGGDRADEAFSSEEKTADAKEVLQLALSRLGAPDRMLTALYYFDEYSVEECARLLGWSGANVKVRLFRLREKLQRAILALMMQ